MQRAGRSKRPRGGGSLEQQRLENGGYTDAEIDAAILRSQRSDPLSVGIRLGTTAVVYFLLARAIVGGMGAAFLLLPLLVELLSMFWIGLLLSRTVVRCEAFRRSAGSGIGVVVWTLVILGGVAAWLAYQPGEGWSPARIGEAASARWETARAFGMHWAVLASIVGLLLATAREVMAWRPEQGVFVWTSVITTGSRIGLAVLLGMLVALLFAVFGPVLKPLVAALPLAWLVWTVLLVLDVGVVVVLALMHRDFKRKAAGRDMPREVSRAAS
jgi:hypothetical protein